MTNRNKRKNIKREVRRRERRRIEELNRNRTETVRKVWEGILIGAAILLAVALLLLAAAEKADRDAYAAVLSRTRLNLDAAVEDMACEQVPPPPEFPKSDGEPPQAIEIKTAPMADEVPEEHWESLGTWMLSAYCPLECCNGKDRAWTTASGEPMAAGDTVATGKLPFGTKLKIRDHIYTVTDRGVPYGQVDILHESHRSANKFGIQYAEVFILK